jgi:hypothetical protein
MTCRLVMRQAGRLGVLGREVQMVVRARFREDCGLRCSQGVLETSTVS